jgi:hypothetical protein
MRTLKSLTIFAAALVASAGVPVAQDKGMGSQPPAKAIGPCGIYGRVRS